MWEGFSYLLACLLDFLENCFVGGGGIDDDFLRFESNLVRGNVCSTVVWVREFSWRRRRGIGGSLRARWNRYVMRLRTLGLAEDAVDGATAARTCHLRIHEETGRQETMR